MHHDVTLQCISRGAKYLKSSHTTSHDLNTEIKVFYSSHHSRNLSVKPISQTTYDLNSKLLDEQTVLDHLNTKLVCYSDPHCIQMMLYTEV